jgi:ubiquinone/menaquinone biosynthesis C-methylase UbiE
MARELARRGARVTGVDIADRLLDLARRYEEAEPLGIHYLHDDAQSLAALPDARFDGAACNMALMNIPDMIAAFRAVHRVLKPGGWFAFSITHPCFQSPHARWVEKEDGTVVREVREYLAEGLWFSDNSNGVRGKIGDEHRTLSTYINTLTEAGFTIERLLEPPSTGKRAQDVPGELSIPSILLLRCRRENP